MTIRTNPPARGRQAEEDADADADRTLDLCEYPGESRDIS
jgi:hypothetical protein